MSKTLKWIIGILVAIILLMVVLKKMGVFGKEEGIKVTAEKVVKRTIIETVNASGKIFPEVEVKVSPDISGEIVELNVAEGDSVRKGQVLAESMLTYTAVSGTKRCRCYPITGPGFKFKSPTRCIESYTRPS
jgi:multidrug efflux pump subunit AcrA (membrane-fusion protein)